MSLNFNIVNPLQFCSEFAFYGFCTKASFILSFNLHRPRTVGALDMGGASMQVRNHQSNHHVLSSLLFHGQLSMSCFCGSIYTIVFVNINWIYTHHVNKRQKYIHILGRLDMRIHQEVPIIYHTYTKN